MKKFTGGRDGGKGGKIPGRRGFVRGEVRPTAEAAPVDRDSKCKGKYFIMDDLDHVYSLPGERLFRERES